MQMRARPTNETLKKFGRNGEPGTATSWGEKKLYLAKDDFFFCLRIVFKPAITEKQETKEKDNDEKRKRKHKPEQQ